MIEKDLAYLAFELIGLLTKIFQNNQISLEEYISNTILKVNYLEDYVKGNKDNVENTRILQLLAIHHKILKVSCPS